MHFSLSMDQISVELWPPIVIALALGLLWLPLFVLDYRAEKKRRGTPIGSGENPPTPPLDKLHLG